MVSIRPSGCLNHFSELRFALFDTLAYISKFRKLTVSSIIPFRSAPFQALPQSNYGSLSFALFNFQGPVLRRFQQDFFNRISQSRLFLSVSLERSTIIPNRFLFVNTFSQKNLIFFKFPFIGTCSDKKARQIALNASPLSSAVPFGSCLSPHGKIRLCFFLFFPPINSFLYLVMLFPILPISGSALSLDLLFPVI